METIEYADEAPGPAKGDAAEVARLRARLDKDYQRAKFLQMFGKSAIEFADEVISPFLEAAKACKHCRHTKECALAKSSKKRHTCAAFCIETLKSYIADVNSLKQDIHYKKRGPPAPELEEEAAPPGEKSKKRKKKRDRDEQPARQERDSDEEEAAPPPVSNSSKHSKNKKGATEMPPLEVVPNTKELADWLEENSSSSSSSSDSSSSSEEEEESEEEPAKPPPKRAKKA